MRLDRLDRAHALAAKAFLRLIRLASGHPAPDVIKTCLYRPNFFGRPFLALTQQVLRGPSDWSVGERELFAAYTSRLNQCPF